MEGQEKRHLLHLVDFLSALWVSGVSLPPQPIDASLWDLDRHVFFLFLEVQ